MDLIGPAGLGIGLKVNGFLGAINNIIRNDIE